VEAVKYYLSYAFVDATYQTNVTLASVTEANGVQAMSGDRIPGIPRQNIKFGAEVAVLNNLWIGGDVICVSGNYLRGDDGNQQAKVSGYTVLNLSVRYVPIKFLEIWGRVDNATNANYATAGALNWNAFADPSVSSASSPPELPLPGGPASKCGSDRDIEKTPVDLEPRRGQIVPPRCAFFHSP